MQELKPALDKLKHKHKKDKQALAQAQLELYRQHGVNPIAGLLPMIIQIVILIALFQAFNNILGPDNGNIDAINQVLYPTLQLPLGTHLDTHFLYLDISKPDIFTLPFEINLGLAKINSFPGIFLLASAVVQFISSKLMMSNKPASPKQAKKSKKPAAPEDMASSMQTQMLYLMPVMTILIGMSFPSGLVLYWFTFSAVMIAQQLYIRSNSNLAKK